MTIWWISSIYLIISYALFCHGIALDITECRNILKGHSNIFIMVCGFIVVCITPIIYIFAIFCIIKEGIYNGNK